MEGIKRLSSLNRCIHTLMKQSLAVNAKGEPTTLLGSIWHVQQPDGAPSPKRGILKDVKTFVDEQPSSFEMQVLK